MTFLLYGGKTDSVAHMKMNQHLHHKVHILPEQTKKRPLLCLYRLGLHARKALFTHFNFNTTPPVSRVSRPAKNDRAGGSSTRQQKRKAIDPRVQHTSLLLEPHYSVLAVCSYHPLRLRNKQTKTHTSSILSAPFHTQMAVKTNCGHFFSRCTATPMSHSTQKILLAFNRPFHLEAPLD